MENVYARGPKLQPPNSISSPKVDLERNGYIVHSACFRVQSDCICINNAQTLDGVLSTALLEVAPEHLQTQQTSKGGGRGKGRKRMRETRGGRSKGVQTTAMHVSHTPRPITRLQATS